MSQIAQLHGDSLPEDHEQIISNVATTTSAMIGRLTCFQPSQNNLNPVQPAVLPLRPLAYRYPLISREMENHFHCHNPSLLLSQTDLKILPANRRASADEMDPPNQQRLYFLVTPCSAD